jgi:hypothetical protein
MKRARISTVFGLAFALLFHVCAYAADVYFDFKAAGGGDGTISTPYNDLGSLNNSILFMSEPTTLWVSGRARGIIKAATPAYRLGIKQWAGMPQFVLDGTVPISGSAGAAGLFTVTLGADVFDDNMRASADYVGGMVYDWDGSIDSQGRHYNWFTRAANAAAVTAESNTYFYEKSTHLLTFGLSHQVANVANAAAVTSTVANTGKLCWARGNLGGGIEIGTPVYNTPYGTDTGTIAGGFLDGAASSPTTDTTGGAWGGLGSWNLRGWQTTAVDLDGLVVQCFPDMGDTSSTRTAARSMTYGIRIADAVGCTIRRCVTIDTGYHGIGYIGNLCHNNLIEDCVTNGGNASPTRGNSAYVFYTGPAAGSPLDTLDHNIHNCIGRRCWAFQHNLLGCSGTANTPGDPIASAGSQDGFLSHTDNTTGTADGNAVTDVLWEDCWVVESGDGSNLGCIGQPFVSNSGLNPTSTTVLSDETNPAKYAVRVVRGGVVNGTRMYSSARYCSMSFSGSSLHFDRLGANAASTTGYIGATSGVGYSKVLFSGCEIVANLDSTARDVYMFQCGQYNKVLLRNSSVYVTGSPRNTAGTPRTKALVFLANAGGGDSASSAAACVITQTAHGLVNGNTIVVTSSTTGTSITPATYTVTKITNDTFSIPFDTSGGAAGLVEWYSTFGTLSSVHGSRVYARGTVFGFEQTDWVNSGNNGCGPQFLITGGMSETTAVALGADGKRPLDVLQCAYFNISDNSYFGFAGGTPTMNSESNWKTNRDPSGFYPSRNGTTWHAYDPTAAQVVLGKSGANIFSDMSGRTLMLNAYGRSITTAPSPAPGFAAMNARRFSGAFGAYQAGSPVTAGTGGDRNRTR